MSLLKSLLGRCRKAAIVCARESVRFLAPIISVMARTGMGTDACLRWKCLPLPVHFYSPIPDLADLEKRPIWDRCNELAGIDLRPDAQIALLEELGRRFGLECD